MIKHQGHRIHQRQHAYRAWRDTERSLHDISDCKAQLPCAELGGHISLTFSTTITSTQFIQSRRVRALAVTSAKRVPAFPDVPTVAESGVPGYDFTLWLGLAAPAGTPPAIVQRLSDLLVKTVQFPDVRTKLVSQSVEPLTSTPKELSDRIVRELVVYSKVVKESGATAE